MTADTITIPRAEYDQLLAAPAAALMEAKKRVLRLATDAQQEIDAEEATQSQKAGLGILRDVSLTFAAEISALATTDSTAALKRVIEKALEMARGVKPLEWEHSEETLSFYASWRNAHYRIENHKERGFLVYSQDRSFESRLHPTIEAAQAAAQADYQKRSDAIRPAITADDVLRELGGRG